MYIICFLDLLHALMESIGSEQIATLESKPAMKPVVRSTHLRVEYKRAHALWEDMRDNLQRKQGRDIGSAAGGKRHLEDERMKGWMAKLDADSVATRKETL